MCFAIKSTGTGHQFVGRVKIKFHAEFSSDRKLIYRVVTRDYSDGMYSFAMSGRESLFTCSSATWRRRNQVLAVWVIRAQDLLRCHLQIPTLYEANRPQLRDTYISSTKVPRAAVVATCLAAGNPNHCIWHSRSRFEISTWPSNSVFIVSTPLSYRPAPLFIRFCTILIRTV